MKLIKRYKQSRGACGLGLLRTSKSDPFNSQCNEHDVAYVLYKGTRNEAVRKDIDKTFLKSMLSKKDTTGLRRVRAYIYYCISRLLGVLPWYFGKVKK